MSGYSGHFDKKEKRVKGSGFYAYDLGTIFLSRHIEVRSKRGLSKVQAIFLVSLTRIRRYGQEEGSQSINRGRRNVNTTMDKHK